jgi:hypothetical protein
MPPPGGVVNKSAGDPDEILFEIKRYPLSITKEHHNNSTIPLEVRWFLPS